MNVNNMTVQIRCEDFVVWEGEVTEMTRKRYGPHTETQEIELTGVMTRQSTCSDGENDDEDNDGPSFSDKHWVQFYTGEEDVDEAYDPMGDEEPHVEHADIEAQQLVEELEEDTTDDGNFECRGCGSRETLSAYGSKTEQYCGNCDSFAWFERVGDDDE